MRESVKQGFLPFATRFDPLVSWMYLNRAGNVVTALGCSLEPITLALELPWVLRDGKQPAEENHIAGDWLRIKRNRILAHKGPTGSAPYTNVELTQEGIERLVIKRLYELEQRFADAGFVDFDDWPADVQLAGLSMAWLDADLFEHFPKWSKAMKQGAWRLGAKECFFRTTHHHELVGRNWAHRKLLLSAALADVPKEELTA